MNIFRQYTLKSLWKNKIRTLVTIIGIILSAAMFTAVTTSVSSIYHFLLEVTVQNEGCWHANILSPAEENIDGNIKEILSGSEIDKRALLYNVCYGKLDTVKRKSSPYLYIGSFDGDFPELLSVHMTAGRLPQNSSELILPKNMAELSGITLKSGDSIKMENGIRTDKESGGIMWQDTVYDEDNESFVSNGEKTYRVVGIYESADFGCWGYSLDRPGYTALTKADSSTTDLATAYITLKHPKQANDWNRQLVRKYGENIPVNLNQFYLAMISGFTGGNLGAMIIGLTVILIGIIMFGSIALIYNSFSISVNERKKQYGLLSSIGATKKQLGKSVIFESVIVSLIGIPLGVLAGIGGMSATFYCLQDNFSVFLGNSDTGGLTLHMTAALWAIGLAAGIGFITVLISAYLPARKALKLNAVEAIRQNADIVIKPKTLKTSRLTLRLFGLEGALASKNYKRNKRKYRATVFSLFISVVLFISASSFCSYLNNSINDLIRHYDCDLRYRSTGVQTVSKNEELYQKLQKAENVTSHTSHYVIWDVAATISSKYLSDSFYRNATGYPKPTDERELEEKISFENINLVFVEDELYQHYLEKNKLDTKRYMSADKPTAVAYDKGTIYNTNLKRYQETHSFTKNPGTFPLNYLAWDADAESDTGMAKIGETSVTIGAICDNTPEGVDFERYYAPLLLYPLRALNTVCPPDIQKKMDTNEYVVTFCSDNPDKTYVSVDSILSESLSDSSGSYSLYNVAEQIKSNRALMTILNVFSYGFILLISLIAVANVFNTISTNVFLRRREFATLRSVGMTQKAFYKMSCFECLLYGMKGLMYGLPVAIGITALIWYAVGQEMAIGFYIPLSSIVIAIGSVFAVVFATMLYSTNKLKKDNLIDVLKEENY